MAKPPLILAFDTSAAHCAAAVILGDSVVASLHEPMAKGQAERLVPMLQECLSHAGAGWRDLAALGVGIGPGNFTGTRIAVSTARGIALARGIPAHGVSAFDALAYGLPRPVLAAIDARQGRVYLRQYRLDGEDTFVCELGRLPDAISLAETRVCGDLAGQIAEQIAAPVVASADPLAVAIAKIAASRPPGTARPSPLYLRPADAAPSRDLPPVMLA